MVTPTAQRAACVCCLIMDGSVLCCQLTLQDADRTAAVVGGVKWLLDL